MDMTQMKIFLCATKTLNFTETAKQLYLSQPTVTYQIKLLEKELNRELFSRNTHGVELTKAGNALCKGLLGISAIWEDTLKDIKKLDMDNQIIIGFPGSQFFEIVAGFMPDFNKKNNEHHIRLYSYPFIVGIKPLLEREVNFMFLYDYQIRNMKNISMIPLVACTVSVFLSRDSDLSVKKHLGYGDLSNQTIIVTEAQKAEAPFMKILDGVVNESRKVRVIYVADHNEQISMVIANQGILITPSALKFVDSVSTLNIPFDDFETGKRGLAYLNDDKRESTKILIKYFANYPMFV